MIPIAIGSVAALAIFIERIWALQRTKVVPPGLVKKVLEVVEKKEFSKARDLCLASNSSMGRVLLSGIDARHCARGEIKEHFEETGRQEVARMNRFIEALGTTASIEPLLGLLGTVTGMITVFQQVVTTSSSGAVDPAQLASGIWQALITTAAGLSVAIPAFLGYRYLQGRSDDRANELEEGSLFLLSALVPKSCAEKTE